MDPIEVVYGACRHFFDDNTHRLRDETRRRVDGFLRSRHLPSLCDLCGLFGVDYLTPDEFRVFRQISAFFKKNVAFCDDSVALPAARQAFVKAEQRCRVTNRRLDHYYVHRDRLDPDVDFWLSRMEADIANLLGPFSDFLDSMPKGLRITSGASTLHSRKQSKPFAKVTKRMSCTPGAVPYLSALSEWFGYGKIRPRLLLHNRVEFVPKNWKTHRTIACEPTGNTPLQLAFDSFAKHRLYRWGINLRDQLVNQEKAKQGSVDGSFATIDLSAASDTVAFNTVAWLFPEPYFRFLNAIRAPRYHWDGRSVTYSKFSSMGNGATFAIETILFTAACRAVGSKHYSVYGDDIIIEPELVPNLRRLFRFLGFSINSEKSFTTGPFRESCGYDAYCGTDITPFYVRELDRRKVTQCHFVNGCAAIATPGGRLADYLKSLVETWALPFVPYNESSISGVWIDPGDALLRGLIHYPKLSAKGPSPWVPLFKGFVPCVEHSEVFDIRTLFLWYLDKYRREGRNPRVFSLFRGHKMTMEGESVATRIPTFSHRYRRKWLHWNPVPSIPVHLYWWTEHVTRLKG